VDAKSKTLQTSSRRNFDIGRDVPNWQGDRRQKAGNCAETAMTPVERAT